MEIPQAIIPRGDCSPDAASQTKIQATLSISKGIKDIQCLQIFTIISKEQMGEVLNLRGQTFSKCLSKYIQH